MAAKAAVRTATKPKKAKATRRATRKAARKAKRVAMKPKAPKAKATKRVAAKKVMKPKFVSKKSQTGSLRKVWNGTATYTKSGYTKKDLCLTSTGKVVSKKQYERGLALKKSPWNVAFLKARKQLGITGFVTLNRGAQGKALYNLAKQLCK